MLPQQKEAVLELCNVVLFSVLMVGAVVLFFVNRTDLLVPVIHVALLAFASWMVMYVVSAVTVLVLYRRAV